MATVTMILVIWMAVSVATVAGWNVIKSIVQWRARCDRREHEARQPVPVLTRRT